jgi:carbon storage regulator
MLVLSRKKNETIVVGNARITIVEIRGDKIKVGIEAPMEVNVDRLEVWEAKQRALTNKAIS